MSGKNPIDQNVFSRSTKYDVQSTVLNRLLAFDREMAQGLDGGGLAGVDEVGRGPLAGPVVAAAVILFRPSPLEGLNDSKKVTPRHRETLFREISRCAIVSIGVVDEKQIDEINIYQATRRAMVKAVLGLPRTPSFLLIDGNLRLDLPIRQQAVIGGDYQSASIAAASIMAKVYRDAWMMHLDKLYPAYQFGKHKGYATADHRVRLSQEGPSPVHRKSFAPVRVLLKHPSFSFGE